MTFQVSESDTSLHSNYNKKPSSSCIVQGVTDMVAGWNNSSVTLNMLHLYVLFNDSALLFSVNYVICVVTSCKAVANVCNFAKKRLAFCNPLRPLEKVET